MYACDERWWNVHYSEVKATFKGKLWSQDKSWTRDENGKSVPYTLPDINYVESRANYGLSVAPGVIHQGQNSGYQAINLALMLGYNTVALLGFDMQGRGEHWFGQHASPDLSQKTDYGALCREFERMKPDLYGLTVINCTRSTGLTCFPRMKLEDFLESDYLRDGAELNA